MEPETNTPQTPTPAPTPRTRGWVRVLLVVSLALNLLVIGAIAGVAIKGGPWKHRAAGGHPVESSMGPLTRALSKEDRRAIGRQIRQSSRDGGWNHRKHRQALAEIVSLLEAPTLDEAALREQFVLISGGVATRLSTAQQVLADYLAQMDDEERAEYAMRVQEVMERRKKRLE